MDRTFDPDSFNGMFVFNTCRACQREFECFRIEVNFVCDDCLPPEQEIDEIDHGRTDDYR